jgi:hypothetical protein
MLSYRSVCGNCVCCGKSLTFSNDLVADLPTIKYQDRDESQVCNCVSHDMMFV